MNKEHGQKSPEATIIPIREIHSVADVVRELDLLHNKHTTKVSADEFFHRVATALADLPAEHETTTAVTLFIDNVEYRVSLQKTGRTFSLAVTKAETDH